MGKPSGSTINGTRGDDIINGTGAAETINGNAGNDRITGGGGYDTLLGGDGDDTLIDDVNGATFDGGKGIDTLDFSASTGGIGVDLGYGNIHPVSHVQTGVVITGNSIDAHITHATDTAGTVTNIENVTGGAGGDYLGGSWGDNVLNGGGGDDYIEGRYGADTINGGDGADLIIGGPDNDTVTGGAGVDRFVFGGGVAGVVTHDVVTDYTPGEDILVFAGNSLPTAWTPVTVGGVASIQATTADGLTVLTLIGVTDASSLQIEHFVV